MSEENIPSTRGAVDLSALANQSPQATDTTASAAASWTTGLDEAAFQQFVGLSQSVPAIVSLGSPRVQASADLDAVLR